MKIKPNRRYDAFVAELKKFKRRFSKWEGIAFRAAPLEFARLARLLDGQGGFKTGGRWLAAGYLPVVNLSTLQGGYQGEQRKFHTLQLCVA